MGRLLYVTGGARSGKSAQAERLATGLGQPVVFLATMQAGDEELEARIAGHRARRADGWATLEEPLHVAAALTACAAHSTVLLDCLSLWVANHLFECVPDADAAAVSEWEAAIASCVSAAGDVLSAGRMRPGALIAVTNEVGLGIVPGDRLSRYYRDALGLVNQGFARHADEAYLMVSGLPVRLPAVPN